MADSTSTKQTDSTSVTETQSSRGPASFGGYTGQNLANSLLGILTQQSQQIGSLETGRRAAAAENIAASQQSDKLAAEAAAQAAVQAGTKAALNYRQNSALESYQRELGLDPADTQNILSKSLAAKETLRPQYEAARAEYDAAASTSLLDNPLGFIMAQLKLPSLAAKTNALSAAMGRADQRMQVANEHLDERRKTLIANNADQIREAELAQADIDNKLAASRLETAKAATAGKRAGEYLQQIQSVEAIGDRQRQTISQLAQFKEQEEARVERRQRMALIDEQRKQLMEEKAAKAEDTARFNEQLAAVSKKLGYTDPVTYAEWLKLPEAEKKAWHIAAKTGQMGDSLYDSLLFYGNKASRAGTAQAGNAASYDAYLRLDSTGRSYQSQAEREAAAAGKRIKPEEARAQGFHIYADRLLNSAEGVKSPDDLASSKWDTGKEYNPYKAPVLRVADLAQSDPRFAALKNNEVTKAVASLASTTSARGQLSTEQEQAVLQSIYEKVRTRQVHPAKAAADVAAFYTAAAEYNYSQTQYDLFGLPKQRAYLYSLEIGNDRRKTDLFNPAEIERTLQRAVTRDARSQPTLFSDPIAIPPSMR